MLRKFIAWCKSSPEPPEWKHLRKKITSSTMSKALTAAGLESTTDKEGIIMKVDRKFRILAVNATTNKLYTENDSLVLLAKDQATPAALKAYREECVRLGSNPEHIQSIDLLITRVALYQDKHGSKVPDTVGAEIPLCLADRSEGSDEFDEEPHH